MKAHFETVQTKGHRFWKWKQILKLSKPKEIDFENKKHLLKLSQVKETYFENESAFWNCPNYPSLLARCFIPVVSLQNYFQKYHTCGDLSNRSYKKLSPSRHFENKCTFWKSMHILKMYMHILKMNAHVENEWTFWKWMHILKMNAHFENESTSQNC